MLGIVSTRTVCCPGWTFRMMLPGGLYLEAGGTPMTVPLTYTVALPIYVLPTSVKVT